MAKSKLTKSSVDAYNRRNSNSEDYMLEFERPDIDLAQAALIISNLSGLLSGQANDAITNPNEVDYDDVIEILARLLWNIQVLAHVLDTSIEEISEMDIYPSFDDSKDNECSHCGHCHDEDESTSASYDIMTLKNTLEKIAAKHKMPNEQFRIEIDTPSQVVAVYKKISSKK